MNSKLIISCILVPCFLTSFAIPCTGEDIKTGLTVKNIAFTRFKDGMERIDIFCNQSCVPELSSLEGGNPRVVMDMEGVSLVQAKSHNISAGGKLVKNVRSYLDKKSKILRIVLDMDPAKYYILLPTQDSSGNYMLTIKEDGSPWLQEKHITMLRPDLRPGEQERTLKEASSGQEKPGREESEKGSPSLDEGRLQLNAGEFAAAVNTFTDILVSSPHNSLLYRLRGNAYDNLGDRQKAITDWTQAARLGDTAIQSYLDFLQVKWQ
jgi:tetratricopeptide (TPR) repeat protein